MHRRDAPGGPRLVGGATQPIVVALWSLLFLIPFAVVNGAGASIQSALECIVDDYLTFIVLLFGLFCVAGNITLEGDLAGSPRVNVALLLFGTMLSSLVGTTGASMLMVRPLLKMNSWRKRRRHIMVFFIFLISNIGGCLTPIATRPCSWASPEACPSSGACAWCPCCCLTWWCCCSCSITWTCGPIATTSPRAASPTSAAPALRSISAACTTSSSC